MSGWGWKIGSLIHYQQLRVESLIRRNVEEGEGFSGNQEGGVNKLANQEIK